MSDVKTIATARPEYARLFGAQPTDHELCAESLRRGSRSFNAAALLLPTRIRVPAKGVYAFCRACDDLVDNSADPHDGVALISRRLDAIYAGRPMDHPEDREFARVVRGYSIPRQLPQALVEGFLWDADGRRYNDADELLGYAARVAATVGLMMAILMGVRDRHAFARAADLGLAMQLTNIARDVGEDARHGRIYLPLGWLAAESLDPEDLLDSPRFSPELGRVIARLLALADGFYERSLTGLADLPADCRIAIASAARIYRAIGREIEENGHDSVDHRAHTSAGYKTFLIAASLHSLLPAQKVATAAPDTQTQFLVEAACAGRTEAPRNLNEKLERFLELLEQSGRAGMVATSGRAERPPS